MTKTEIINFIMSTPINTNWAVLSSQLGEGDYSKLEKYVKLTPNNMNRMILEVLLGADAIYDGTISVTGVDQETSLNYFFIDNLFFTDEVIKVIFDDEEFLVPGKSISEDEEQYGDGVFPNINVGDLPFFIRSYQNGEGANPKGTFIYFADDDEHHVKIEAMKSEIAVVGTAIVGKDKVGTEES